MYIINLLLFCGKNNLKKYMNKKTYLASVGDVNNYKTWGGIPFFLLMEAKKKQVIDIGLNLNSDKLRFKFLRYIWNLWSMIRYKERGGFQYSDFFLSILWRSSIKEISGNRVINCFQLYPMAVMNDKTIELWFYIDQTLRQLYKDYKVEHIIGKRIIDSSIERETLGYVKAKRIIVHSNWCLDSLVNDYGIPREKISVILPGANLHENYYQEWVHKKENHITKVECEGMLKLVFVGKHPERKGLDRLIGAFRIARGQGALISLRIIGCNKESVGLSESEYDKDVEWIGMVDKNKYPKGYFSLVGGCDVGCLLSRAEAGGISLREFHALGLAVIYPIVGGSPEHAMSGASIGVGPDMTNVDIAKILVRLSSDRLFLERLKAKSWKIRNNMLNSHTVNLISKEFQKEDYTL